MTRDEAGPAPIAADGYPDPVLEYRERDGTPVVTAVNDAFRARFGAVPEATPLPEAFDRAGIDPATTDESLADRMLRGVRTVVRADGPGEAADGERYVATAVPRDESAGHVVLTASAGDPGLDRVASVVSHDLRNPLEVARTRLRVGRETGDDEHFEHVARAHDRMERIIEDVLTLARGEDAVDPSERVDLTEVARSAWCSVDTDDASVAVEALPTAVVDPDRVGRLFENLFRNALEHGRPEGADDDPSVRVGPTHDGFYVADDGPGIPPGEREAVFEPGYSTDDHGTGLGLAIVDRIAAAHDWTVAATESTEGGARIEVRGIDRDDR